MSGLQVRIAEGAGGGYDHHLIDAQHSMALGCISAVNSAHRPKCVCAAEVCVLYVLDMSRFPSDLTLNMQICEGSGGGVSRDERFAIEMGLHIIRCTLDPAMLC